MFEEPSVKWDFIGKFTTLEFWFGLRNSNKQSITSLQNNSTFCAVCISSGLSEKRRSEEKSELI